MKHLSEYGPEFTEALNNIKLRIGKDKPKKDRFMEEKKPEQTDQNGEPMTYWGKSSSDPEPTIPLSEVGKFSRFCIKEGYEYSANDEWDLYYNDQIVDTKSTADLLEIFRSGKENLTK